ncbi:uncharacterized protein LOC129596497 [Paramacrobiotus metropolitanus]|uniref:uncharacterized protein LOC129596497 n=1 Tax=Paramacrobiotus metropolitanus TaxID=2943436 RepID=UPI002445EDC0|nr:uncharacterized protein LOC129596497 [Paramacrobiotus metropolitanus]
MVIAFIVYRELRTSFTIYLLFLFCANIIYAVGQYPLEVIRQGFPGGYWLPHSVCCLHMYLNYAFAPVAMHMHVLITLNRLWATTFPLSYKQVYSKKVAASLCVLMAVYVQLLCLPLVVLDFLYYHLPEREYGCIVNTEAQVVYSAVVAIVSTDVPVVVVLGAYPLLWYKEKQRRKTRLGMKAEMTTKTNLGGPADANTFRRKAPSTSRPFVILTLLTFSVTICWTLIKCYGRLILLLEVLVTYPVSDTPPASCL